MSQRDFIKKNKWATALATGITVVSGPLIGLGARGQLNAYVLLVSIVGAAFTTWLIKLFIDEQERKG